LIHRLGPFVFKDERPLCFSLRLAPYALCHCEIGKDFGFGKNYFYFYITAMFLVAISGLTGF
jgi:hypothetical protein